MFTRDVSQHQMAYQLVTQLERQYSPFFCPPVPAGMREPGTNYYTLVTADGPHTIEHPGIMGGITVHANNRKQNPVAPLTRKGG
jgi:hypothetical protein